MGASHSEIDESQSHTKRAVGSSNTNLYKVVSLEYGGMLWPDMALTRREAKYSRGRHMAELFSIPLSERGEMLMDLDGEMVPAHLAYDRLVQLQTYRVDFYGALFCSRIVLYRLRSPACRSGSRFVGFLC